MVDLVLIGLFLVCLYGAYRLGFSAGEVDALTDLNRRRLP